jgi:hypothetical protein
LQSSHDESNVSLHKLESTLSSASNGYDVPAAMGPTLQTDLAEMGMSYDPHPQMALSSAMYNNAAANIPSFWNPNPSGDEQTLGSDTISQEGHMSTDGNEKANGSPRYA